MGQMKEAWEDYNTQEGQDRANEFAFDLTMQILHTGKKDVLKEIDILRSEADDYAEKLVAAINFKSPIEREIAKDCAKAGFISALTVFKTICSKVLRADYVG